jgi:hypothetical protein
MKLSSTPLWKKRQELEKLQKRHQAEFVVLFREMTKLIRDSAINCEHNFVFDTTMGTHCSICGISNEQYNHNRHYRGDNND